MILGSDIFESTYEQASKLKSESYLKLFDKTLLNKSMRSKLFEWLEISDNFAAIITNRPTSQTFGNLSTPEGELGAKLVGIESIPMIGSGDIRWLAKEKLVGEGILLKPAPTHALAAILAALGNPIKKCLIDAYQYIYSDSISNLRLGKYDTIFIFEDTSAGIISVSSLQEHLYEKNIGVNIRKIGISDSPDKTKVLKELGADTFISVNNALNSILN